MNKNVQMRYELCERCLSEHCHTELMNDELIRDVVICSLKRIGLVLFNKKDTEWANYPVIVSRETGWINAFADSSTNVCRDCNYAMEHTIFGGEKNEK